MARLPVQSGAELVRIFERAGWTVDRQRGSHVILVKDECVATLSVPDHLELAQGTLRTGTFTREAVDYAARIDTTIVLVDGRTLARLMFLHDVGCAPAQTFVVKKLDSDSFVEECAA